MEALVIKMALTLIQCPKSLSKLYWKPTPVAGRDGGRAPAVDAPVVQGAAAPPRLPHAGQLPGHGELHPRLDEGPPRPPQVQRDLGRPPRRHQGVLLLTCKCNMNSSEDLITVTTLDGKNG